MAPLGARGSLSEALPALARQVGSVAPVGTPGITSEPSRVAPVVHHRPPVLATGDTQRMPGIRGPLAGDSQRA